MRRVQLLGSSRSSSWAHLFITRNRVGPRCDPPYHLLASAQLIISAVAEQYLVTATATPSLFVCSSNVRSRRPAPLSPQSSCPLPHCVSTAHISCIPPVFAASPSKDRCVGGFRHFAVRSHVTHERADVFWAGYRTGCCLKFAPAAAL